MGVDHRRFLNYLIGQAEDADPPRDHDKYDELTRRVQ